MLKYLFSSLFHDQDCYTHLMDWIKQNHIILATCSVIVAALQVNKLVFLGPESRWFDSMSQSPFTLLSKQESLLLHIVSCGSAVVLCLGR